ncbi:MAG: hypothetical protein WEA29_09040 [Acidimicrobiia bacterium]
MYDQTRIVDIDSVDSWPPLVLELIDRVIDSLVGDDWLRYPRDHFRTGDFEEEERLLREALSSHRLLAHHAARLLQHEIDDIQESSGLRVLTEDLRLAKVQSALEHYPELAALDPGGTKILSDGPNSWQGTAGGRIGTIDFVAPFSIFEHQTWGFWNLFDTWGGETLGWLKDGRESSELLMRLTEASKPVIVEFGARVATLNTYKMLLPAFVGSRGSADDYWGQWRTNESIPPDWVGELITPDSPRWPDGHVEVA